MASLSNKIKISGKKEKSFLTHDRSHSKEKSAIPEILMKNMRNLTDVDDSFDLDPDFDKASTSRTFSKTPSPQKKTSNKALFSKNMQSPEKKIKSSSKKVDKRLIGLKMEERKTKNSSLLSSPSIMSSSNQQPRSSTPKPFEEDTKNDEKNAIDIFNDTFDKLVNSGSIDKINFDNDDKKEVKETRMEKEQPTDDSIKNNKSSFLDDLPPLKDVSMNVSVKINPHLVSYMKTGQENFRQIIEKVKDIK